MTWEDEPVEISRRLRSMNRSMNLSGRVEDRLRVLDASGRGPLWQPLSERNNNSRGAATEAGNWVREWARRNEIRILAIDPLAAAFACNENDRGIVRTFMSDWDRWARATDCAVAIIAHPSKGDSETSGSTDWFAAARWIWKLERPKLEGPNAKRSGLGKPRLTTIKGNYGPMPATSYYDLKACGAGWEVDTTALEAEGRRTRGEKKESERAFG